MIEVLYGRGLIKVIVATPSLILHSYMHFRCVVVDNLPYAEGQEYIDPARVLLAEAIGCAGRVGDAQGIVIINHQNHIPFARIGELFSSRVKAYRSNVRLSLKASCCLEDAIKRSRWEQLHLRSFNRYTDLLARSVGSERLHALYAERTDLQASLISPMGDYEAYWKLRRNLLPETVRARAVGGHSNPVPAIGDIIELAGDHCSDQWAVVVKHIDQGALGPCQQLVTLRGGVHRLRPLATPITVVIRGHVTLPTNGSYQKASFRKAVSKMIESFLTTHDPDRYAPTHPGDGHDKSIAMLNNPNDLELPAGSDLSQRYVQLYTHPVHQDYNVVNLDDNARQHDVICLEIESIERAVTATWERTVNQQGPLTTYLRSSYYLDRYGIVSPYGQRLQQISSPYNYLILHAIDQRILDGLTAAELAGWVSLFTSKVMNLPACTSAKAPVRLVAVTQQTYALQCYLHNQWPALRKLTPGQPRKGLALATWLWADGASVPAVMKTSRSSLTDFIVSTKTVIGLLHDISSVSTGAISQNALQAVNQLQRSVVDW